MLTSVIVPVIVSVFVLATGDLVGRAARPRWELQPARVKGSYDSARSLTRLETIRLTIWLTASSGGDHPSRPGSEQLPEVLVRSLRAVGIMPRSVERPVVGPKAYVRLWQRLRSLIVLAAMVIGLGIVVAVVIGVIVVGLAFLLENAIS